MVLKTGGLGASTLQGGSAGRGKTLFRGAAQASGSAKHLKALVPTRSGYTGRK